MLSVVNVDEEKYERANGKSSARRNSRKNIETNQQSEVQLGGRIEELMVG